MISNEQDGMQRAKSSAVRLAKYLLYGKDYDPDNELNRCLGTGSNAVDDNNASILETALEMESLAGFKPNKEDLIKHITISLPVGEHLTLAQWENAVKEHLKQLGCSDYVSCWAVHKDTDNEHAHLVICRVHPKTHRLFTFPYSHKRLQQADYDCERRFDLQVDNHPLIEIDQSIHDRKTRTKAETRAKDLESKTMQQSFFSYVNSHIDEINACHSWQELHLMLARLGIELEKKGRGLIFKTLTPGWTENSSADKYIAIKGSSLGTRGSSCSLSDLEKKFGEYQENRKSDKVEVIDRFEARPLNFNESTEKKVNNEQINKSFTRFQEQKAAYEKAVAEYKFAKSKLYEDFRRFQRKTKLEQINSEQYIREHFPVHEQKKQLKFIRQEFRNRRAQQRNKLNEALETLRKNYSKLPKVPKTFQDYLTQTSQTEHDAQREILMTRRNSMRQTAMNFVEGTNQATVVAQKITLNLRYVEIIRRTHKGQEIFRNRLNRDLIRDDGRKILTTRFPSVETVRDLLVMAAKRYGGKKPVKINGTADFQRMCAVVAAKLQIDIQCQDADVQKFYQYRRNFNDNRAEYKQHRTGFADTRTRGIFTRTGLEREIAKRTADFFRARIYEQPEHLSDTGSIFNTGSIFDSGRNYRSTKSDSSKVAERKVKQTSTDTGSDLREMFTGHVDAAENTSTVFMSGHQADVLGQPGKGRLSDRMRRQVYGHGEERGGINSSDVPLAVQAYIDERNVKLQKGIKDILPHQYWRGQYGTFRSLGIRKLGEKENDKYILLEQKGKVFIRKLPDFLLKNTTSIAKGRTIVIDERGYFIFKDIEKQSHTRKL